MKSLMVVSQSNSGSTWFSNCIKASAPHLRWAGIKEFFNPALNWNREATLGQVFGSEMETTMPKLARVPDDVDLERVLAETWDQSGFTFTKENYLAFQINCEPMRRRFSYVGLLGNVYDCFPPERNRVRLWYEAYFRSMILNKYFDAKAQEWLDQHCTRSQDKALIAWQCVYAKVVRTLNSLQLPMFTYRSLMTSDMRQLVEMFMRLQGLGIDPRELAWRIHSTRQGQPLRLAHVEEWREPFATMEKFRSQQFGYTL